MSVYYNEFDKEKCHAMALLMAEGIIPHGDIDERPVQEVTANDVKGYTQCHFFAGWGGWAYALQIAGWPATSHVWTGSCPCQPFSSAGRQKGKADDRHLWPEWFRLIRELRPTVCFGEQVESAVAHGWLDDVYQGLEAEGYAVGAAVLPACSVGAPHRRERLWFVANTEGIGGRQRPEDASRCDQGSRAGKIPVFVEHGTVGDMHGKGLQRRKFLPERPDELASWSSGVEWIDCPDGKQRLVKSGVQLLADGYPNRRLLLHIAGDSIVPQVAAEFINAYMETREGMC